MTSISLIDPQLVQAYRETDYCVFGDPGFVIRLGEASPGLLDAHRSAGAQSSAFLTACNPFSAPHEPVANARRQALLTSHLTDRGYVHLPGEGRHPSNGWPPEESCFVLGLSLEDATDIGARFEQNAIVWCGADGLAHLILLR